MYEARVRVGQAGVHTFEPCGDSLAVGEELVEGLRRISVPCVATAPEGAAQCDGGHRKVTAQGLGHPVVVVLNLSVARVVAERIQVYFQSRNGL